MTMTRMIPIRVGALLGLVLCLAGCGASATMSPSPPAPPSAATPSIAASQGAPESGRRSTIEGCPTMVQAGAVPSDRLIDMAVESGLGVDRVTFTFGPPTGNSAAPTGELRPVAPPFAEGASGAPVTIAGDRFVSIIFRGMTVSDESGNAVYRGPMDLKPIAPAIQELRLLDNFEGHLGWVAGIRGPGCVRATRLTSPDRILVEVQQP
jgi:hypothetical protein